MGDPMKPWPALTACMGAPPAPATASLTANPTTPAPAVPPSQEVAAPR